MNTVETSGSAAVAQETDAGRAGKRAPQPYGRTPGRFHFMLRRVHSLAGLLFGGFVVMHLMVNATAVKPRDYQLNVDKIHSIEPMLAIIETTTIFIPLLLHAIYGIYIIKAGVKFNTTKYAYGGNIRYLLQRWTAVILLAFLAFHIGTLHKWGLVALHYNIDKLHPPPDPLPHNDAGQVDMTKFDMLQRFSYWCNDYGGRFNPHNFAYQTTVGGVRTLFDYSDQNTDPFNDKLHLANAVVIGFYLLGIWCATFHLANGLWTSAIAWGLTVTATAQKRWGHVCLAIGIIVTIAGTQAWYAFALSPKAHGDLGRWDDWTHTTPDDSTLHEPDSPHPDAQPAVPPTNP